MCCNSKDSGVVNPVLLIPFVFDRIELCPTSVLIPPLLTFKNFDDVIKQANNQVAGLASYVCTNSMELANKTSEALETGMVAVNTPFISNAETPFGGIKQSGYGREGGSLGIKDYLNVKYTHLGILG